MLMIRRAITIPRLLTPTPVPHFFINRLFKTLSLVSPATAAVTHTKGRQQQQRRRLISPFPISNSPFPFLIYPFSSSSTHKGNKNGDDRRVRRRRYHDGRPRGPLWRGKKLIGKEALFAIMGLKRFKDDEEKLERFVENHVLRLLKLDMITVLTELERQVEVDLALKMFRVIQKEQWYKPDVYLYKDLIIALARSKQMDVVMQLWEEMRKENLFPDSQTYTEIIRGFLKQGSTSDAMNVYEDMLKSPEPPEELPFRVLLKGLLPHPLLRNKVKKDFEELFPERHIYDPPEEIFGVS